MIEKKQITDKEENAVLVGLVYKEQTEQQLTEYLDELAFLAKTAETTAVKKFPKKMPKPSSGLINDGTTPSNGPKQAIIRPLRITTGCFRKTTFTSSSSN